MGEESVTCPTCFLDVVLVSPSHEGEYPLLAAHKTPRGVLCGASLAPRPIRRVADRNPRAELGGQGRGRRGRHLG